MQKIHRYIFLLGIILLVFGQCIAPTLASASSNNSVENSTLNSTGVEKASNLSDSTSEQLLKVSTGSKSSARDKKSTILKSKTKNTNTKQEQLTKTHRTKGRTGNTGDDGIQVNISVTDPILSANKVTAVITVQGSESAMSPGSEVTVEIPNSIVSSGGLNLDAAKLEGFDGPKLKQVNGKYQLVYTKNSDTSAIGSQATITWKAPLWQGNNGPGQVTSTIAYEDSNDSTKDVSDAATSTTQGGDTPPRLPSIAKWTLMSNTNDIPGYKNVALMDPNHPNKNVYTLAVNYNKKSYQSAKVTDTLPADTHFEYPSISVQQNDFTAINNIRVLKATSSNSSGWPEGFKNVTSTYASSISVSGNTFNVDLGDSLEDGSSFVIEYAVAADKGQTQASYGVKKNNASFTHTDIDGTSGVNNTSAKQAIDDNSNGSFTLNKDVKQTQYISGSKYLDYTITIKNNKNFNIPSGSKIEDSLVEGLSYVSTNSNSSNVDLTPDVNGNSVSWRINKELVSGESAVVHFRVKVDENKFKSGDKIGNTAVLHRQGGKDLTSNTSSVYTYNGKIKIIKTDADTGSKLAGAEFDVLDQDGKVVDHVKTSSDGTIISKTLPTGDYSVKETKAPEGYELSEKDYTVHLDYQHAKNGIVEVNVEDIPDTTSTTDTSDTTDTTSTTDTSDTTDTTSTTDTSDTTDTTSTTDTSDTTDTTSTTDTSDTTDTTSTTDTSDTTDTTSTTDTSDTTDTTSTTDTSDTTDTTSTTDTSDTTDTTSTTDTSDTTDTTSTTDTSDTTDTTSTTDTSDTTDTTSTTDTSDTTDTTSTTDTSDTTDTTSTTDTSDTTDTTSTTDTSDTTDTTSTTDTSDTTDTTSTTDTSDTTDTTSTTDTSDTTDTTSTTDTSDTTDTTSTTDTSDTTNTTSTTDTSDTTDTTSTTDTSDTTDTTSTTDTSDTTDTTSTTDTSDTTDTTSTTDTSDTTDTTSTTDTSDTTDTTSTTDTSDTTDTTSTTDTSDTTDTTSTTDTRDTTDTTSTTDTRDTTDTTSTTDTKSTSDEKVPGKDTSSSSKGPKSPLTSLLPQTGEKGGWLLTAVGVILLGLVGWFIFRKKH
jgi:LPXTG-motif cell wall-anchored protein